MSTNNSRTSDSSVVPAQPDPTRDQLFQYMERHKSHFQAVGITPDAAIEDDDIRHWVIKAYWKDQNDQAELKLNRAKPDLLDLFKNLAGVTPEQEQHDNRMKWVMDYARYETDKLPVPKMDGEGNHSCATAEIVSCCDGQELVKVFVMNEEGRDENGFYGICQTMVDAFKETVDKHDKNPRLYYMGLGRARHRMVHAQQIAQIASWAMSFVYGKAEGLPEQRKDGEGKGLCGLPACCGGTQLAMRYALYNGVIYGLCDRASEAYSQVYGQTDSRLVKVTADPKKLENVLDQELLNKPLFTWVDRFVSGETEETGENPVPRSNEADELNPGSVHYVCAVHKFAGCCDGSQPATHFPTFNGEVYGICKKASWAFYEGGQRHDDPEILRCTPDFNLAVKFAANWRERNIGNDQSDSSTDSSGARAARITREKAQKARQLARQEENDKARPKPNQGSGDIAAQSMGKGNGSSKPNGKNGGKKK